MNNIYAYLCSLTVYREILSLPVMKYLQSFYQHLNNKTVSDYELIDIYAEIYHQLAVSGFEDMGSYLTYHLKYDVGPYPEAVTLGKDSKLKGAASRDISIFRRVICECELIKSELLKAVSPELRNIIQNMPEISGGFLPELEELESGYKQYGYGMFAMGRAFIWDGDNVAPVKNPDILRQEDMTGYEWQREEVVKNTRALIEGKGNANILLHGDSGTGKSATVKSLIHIPEFYNLRIIEIAKDGMTGLRSLIQLLSSKSQKFILFIDDLCFSGDEVGYGALKSILEGGLGMRPDNVAVYATSNRRHMIRESFSERQGDDIHVSETIQEKSSLSDRFSIRIPFMALSKPEFIKTVQEMASRRGVIIKQQELIDCANKWEIAHGGRTPRVARQFIDYLLSSENKI